jgi:hypothetical protein
MVDCALHGLGQCRKVGEDQRDGPARLNRPGFTGGQNSWRIARYGTDTEEEDREAVFP